ncbi:hypothetical protein OT109_04110 [Phycisphaeraceae bacterium D3-23]
MYCLDCDYCLIGSPGRVCPECGLGFDLDDPATFQPEASGVRVGSGPKKRRLAMALAAVLWSYPFVLIAAHYLTWFTAWGALGHRPRLYIDDPKYISAWVTACFNITVLVMIAFPAAFLIGFFATSWYCISHRRSFFATSALLVTFLGLWGAMIGFVAWDPNNVINWFMD